MKTLTRTATYNLDEAGLKKDWFMSSPFFSLDLLLMVLTLVLLCLGSLLTFPQGDFPQSFNY